MHYPNKILKKKYHNETTNRKKNSLFNNKLTKLITFALTNLVGSIKKLCEEKSATIKFGFLTSSKEKAPPVNLNSKKCSVV